MADNKKWRIEGLSLDAQFCEAGKIILKQRIESLVSSIKIYFESNSAENLHDVRITLRRLRYGMELFYDCFNRKKFIDLYKVIEQLQNLSGSVRDLDVMKENISSLSADRDLKKSQKMLSKIEEKKKDLTGVLNLELMKFYHSKRFKNLYKQL